MRELIIPGFDVRVSNDTYTRKIKITKNKVQTSALEVVQLDIFCAPKQEELLEMIRMAAEASLDGCHPSLAKYIRKKIPDEKERKRLAQMDSVLMGRIQTSMPYLHTDAGRHYLRIMHGIVPKDEVDEFKPEQLSTGVFAYLVGEKSYSKWNTCTRLEERFYLPPLNEIVFAFQNRVFNSSLLMVNCNDNPFLYPEIEKLSRKIYMELRLTDISDLGLDDVSEWVEEKLARKTIRFYSQDSDVYDLFDGGKDNPDENEGEKDYAEFLRPKYNTRPSDN